MSSGRDPLPPRPQTATHQASARAIAGPVLIINCSPTRLDVRRVCAVSVAQDPTEDQSSTRRT